MDKILDFISRSEDWVNLGLVIVGSFAMIIYKLQERKKRIEAASLIVMQINELQNRLREFSSYIVEGQLNSSAFYESLPLMGENYWDKYKHNFVRKMDHIEEQLIAKGVDGQYATVSPQDFVTAMNTCIPGNVPDDVKSTINVVTQQFANQSVNFDFQQFWNRYNQQRHCNFQLLFYKHIYQAI